jgi:cytochrome c
MAALSAVAPLRAADIELGRYLASECMTCHRSATASSTIPNIFGLPEQHLTSVIRAYRRKELPNPVMQNVASRLKDDEIAALAAFFATTSRP